MSRNSLLAKILRIAAIALMGVTAAFTLLGGAGTSCAAFSPNNPQWADSMGPLAQAQWLYILFVFVTLAIGVMGVWAVALLIRGTTDAYRSSLIALVSGVVVGVIHIIASRSLRGKSMPVDMVVYVTVLTLLVFLLLRIPQIWQGVNFARPGKSSGAAAGRGAAFSAKIPAAVTLLLGGLSALSVQAWAGPSHIFANGINYADAWRSQFSLAGWGMIAASAALAAYWLQQKYFVGWQIRTKKLHQAPQDLI